MLGFGRKKRQVGGGTFTFRVSDVVDVPLRGTLLRLRVLEGTPAMTDLALGARLRLCSAGGVEREVRITDYAVTGGRATQERLDRTRELDVVVADADAAQPVAMVEIGWTATGPIT